jgi:hypothetical protein
MQWLVGMVGAQYVRIAVGPVRTETKIIRFTLDPEWNQVFAIGRDKIQGGACELSVWDAVSWDLFHELSTFLLCVDVVFMLELSFL